VAAAWQGKELLRAVYAADGMAAARAALERFYRWSDGVAVAELSRLARTVRAWEAEILAWHTAKGCSNGPTEAVNLLIKKVKRVGHGFRNFDNYRLRLLLHCGVTWQMHQTAEPLSTAARVEQSYESHQLPIDLGGVAADPDRVNVCYVPLVKVQPILRYGQVVRNTALTATGRPTTSPDGGVDRSFDSR
jgi:hypothetical protein